MYPDLSYLFDTLGATRDGSWSLFKTYGLFLITAFTSAGLLLRHELKRRERLGQFTGVESTRLLRYGWRWTPAMLQFLYGFILLGKGVYFILHAPSREGSVGALLFNLEFNLIAGILGGLSAVALYYFSVKGERRETIAQTYRSYPSDGVLTVIIIAIITGVLGARILALLEDPTPFLKDPMRGLFITGGMSVFGGMLLGLVVLGIYLKRQGISLIAYLDAAVPGVFVAYGIGRLGCHFSGDGCWGIPSAGDAWYSFLPDFLVAERYPHNVSQNGMLIEGCESTYCRILTEGVFPTSFYEFMLASTLAGCLWLFRKRWTALHGKLFSVYLILAGTERFLIEFIRVNDKYTVLGFQGSQAQFIAIGYILSGLIILLYFVRGNRGGFGLQAKITDTQATN